MSLTLDMSEREALDALEPRLASRGYSLVREPSAADLPIFLRNAAPSAVALGGPPNLLIEVLNRGAAAGAKPASERLEELRTSLAGHPEWRLEVIYAPTERAAPPAATAAGIRRRAQNIKTFAEREPSGGLVLAWSLLEAAARLLEPKRAARALTPADMVELLLGLGHLDQKDGDTMRVTGRLRNAIAHGDLSLEPKPDQVDAILELVERLLREAEAAQPQQG